MEFLIVAIFFAYGLTGLMKALSQPGVPWLLLIIGLFLLMGQWWAVLGLLFV
jgi:hypothetical protein